MKLQLVTMTHPRLPGQPARVPAQSVQAHQRAGWQLVEDDTPPDAPLADEATTDEGPAPAEASVLPDTDKSPRGRRTRGDE